jgi:HEAT repeat protein
MTREEEDKLVTEALNRLGMDVASVFDLMKWKQPYSAAVPILLEHLPKVQDSGIKEGIIRVLTTKEARGQAGPALITEFRATAPGQRADLTLKWAIGNALSIVANDSDFADLVELVKDKQHGRSREMLAVALGNMRNPAAVNVLIELLNDEEVAGHALMGLAKLKAQEARSHIVPFLAHPKAWVRKEASRALAKLDRRSQ